MKKINTLFAVILSRFPDSKRSINKVIAIRLADGEMITDEDEIRAEFSDNDQIITFQTFQGKNETLLNVGDLVEIPVKEIRPKEAEGHLDRVDHEPMIKRICYEVVEIPYGLFADNCFKLDEVNNILIGKEFKFGFAEFYLSIASQIYGPFKLLNNKIEPKLGKDVTVFRFDPESAMGYLEGSYLLERPKNAIGRGDCMSSVQLMDWIKDQIKQYGNYNGDINNITRLLKRNDYSNNDLERIRFERASAILENIELSINDIEEIFSQTSKWQHLFQKCFEKNESEFKTMHLLNLKDEFAQVTAQQETKSAELDIAISIKENQIAEKLKQADELQGLVDEKNNELNMIEQRRDELIFSIKLQANITENPVSHSAQKTILHSYEIRELVNISQSYFETIDDYLDELKDNWGYTVDKRRFFEASLYSLFESRFLLAANVSFVLSLIRSLGNARICLQPAEIDWIKFGNMFPRGLEQIIESAEASPELLHYYILQDFNLPSFECYGKPLIDLADGIRVMIPGTNRPWPLNLSVVLIPVTRVDTELGFRINAKIFKNWAVLPHTGNTEFGLKGELTAYVDLAAFLGSYEMRHQGDIEDYIS
jgi:hypothetical protein